MGKYFDFTTHDKYTLTPETLDNYCHVVYESIGKSILNSHNEPDLSSFKPRKELCPSLWKDDGHLDSRIRLKLLDIADDFYDSLEVNWVKPDDIILTGSLANYNWSEYSDFDLHILLDFDAVDERTDFVKDYFDTKKNEWNNNHDELNIYGFPVEVYVQDVNEGCTASGIYSLEDNEWIKEPEEDNIKAIKLDKYWIKEKTMKFVKAINTLEKRIDTDEDVACQRKNCEEVDKLFDKLKGIRKNGLDKFGEMGAGNIIYKCVRRLGYLDKLLDLGNKSYDKLNSL